MKIILLYGPPAVGKLTIATLLHRKTGYKLLHNHAIQDPITKIIPVDNPSNRLLVREFRLRMLEEAIKNNISLILTFSIAGNEPFRHIEDIIEMGEMYNSAICLVRLIADRGTILQRVENDSRKAYGKVSSIENLQKMIQKNADMFDIYPKKEHLTIDTANLSPEQAVAQIMHTYNL